jgi:hypothetical protein
MTNQTIDALNNLTQETSRAESNVKPNDESVTAKSASIDARPTNDTANADQGTVAKSESGTLSSNDDKRDADATSIPNSNIPSTSNGNAQKLADKISFPGIMLVVVGFAVMLMLLTIQTRSNASRIDTQEARISQVIEEVTSIKADLAKPWYQFW